MDKRAVHDTKYTTTSVRHGGMDMYSCQWIWFTIIYGLVRSVYTRQAWGFFSAYFRSTVRLDLHGFVFPKRREMHIHHMRNPCPYCTQTSGAEYNLFDPRTWQYSSVQQYVMCFHELDRWSTFLALVNGHFSHWF